MSDSHSISNPYGSSSEFSTTADVGLSIRSHSYESLFAAAGWALFNLILDIHSIKPSVKASIKIQADNYEDLFVDWLNELLFYFDAKHMAFSKFDLHFQNDQLHAEIWGEKIEPVRNRIKNSIKAATYHQLSVIQSGKGQYSARIILDV